MRVPECSPAPVPCVELVAGDPPVVGPVIVAVIAVPPAAVIGAVVDLVVRPGAVLPDPVAVAVGPVVTSAVPVVIDVLAGLLVGVVVLRPHPPVVAVVGEVPAVILGVAVIITPPDAVTTSFVVPLGDAFGAFPACGFGGKGSSSSERKSELHRFCFVYYYKLQIFGPF